jgi:GxxExxY protein
MVTAPVRKITAQQVSHAIITAAMRVHTELGPGLWKAPIPPASSTNFGRQGASVSPKLACPWCTVAPGWSLAIVSTCWLKDLVIVEIKSVDAISPVHQAQLLSYLKLSGKSLGLLINFNVVHLKDGIRRFVNGTGWK